MKWKQIGHRAPMMAGDLIFSNGFWGGRFFPTDESVSDFIEERIGPSLADGTMQLGTAGVVGDKAPYYFMMNGLEDTYASISDYTLKRGINHVCYLFRSTKNSGLVPNKYHSEPLPLP